MNKTRTEPLNRYLNRAHLLYLGLLPIAATFVVLRRYGGGALMWLIFLGGIAAVGAYLAVVVSYTPRPRHWLLALLLLVDGPLAVLLSLDRPAPLALAVESYLVDGLAVWLAILGLSLTSDLPTPGQRVGSVFFMLVAISSSSAVFWPYVREFLLGETGRLLWLAAALVEGIALRYFVLSRELMSATDEDENFTILFIAGLVMVWVIAMSAGNVLFEAAHR